MITSNLRRVWRRSPMTAQQLLRVAVVGLGTSVVPLDSAVNIAFPDITTYFDLPIQMIQWVVICYVLTHASLLLAFGRVGDIFGYGRIFRAGLLWNGAAFLCCAAAPSFGWLLFCRFLQGIGAALILSCAPALVAGLFPEERRSRALAVFTMMHALGSAGGPLLGGMLVDLWGWPAVFWVRAPCSTPRALRKDLPMRSTHGVYGRLSTRTLECELLSAIPDFRVAPGCLFRMLSPARMPCVPPPRATMECRRQVASTHLQCTDRCCSRGYNPRMPTALVEA